MPLLKTYEAAEEKCKEDVEGSEIEGRQKRRQKEMEGGPYLVSHF